MNPNDVAELKVITIEHNSKTYEFKTLDEAMQWAKGGLDR
jgi:hypothetical protein